MKICQISGSYPPDRCGVGDHVAGLAQALAAAGVSVTVLTSNRAGDEPLEADWPRPDRRIATWSALGLAGLLQAIGRIRPDVVHLHYPSAGYGRKLGPNLLLPLIRLRFPKTRCVLTLHEYAVFSRLGRWRLAPGLAACHRIICTNHGDRRALRKQHPGMARKIRVIPLGSNLGEGGPAHSTLPGLWLAHFGTVMPNKGWEVLIPALRQLHDQGLAVKLKVAGELAPGQYAYHRRIRDLIRRERLESFVDFSGFLPRPQARALMQNCGLAVLPFRDGASLNRSSLVAVISLGMAVITTRPAQPLEGLRPGVHYWEVSPGNPGELARAVAKLLADPGLAQRLQQGSLKARGRFAWSRIARQMIAVYQPQSGLLQF